MENKRIIGIYIERIKKNPDYVKSIKPEILENNPIIYDELIKKYPDYIKKIPMAVRIQIPQICITAVKIKPENIKYVPEEVQIANYEMCLNVVRSKKGTLYYISPVVLEGHPEICLEALLEDHECVEDIPEEIIDNNPQIQAMIDVTQDWNKIYDMPIELLKNTPQLCIQAALLSHRKYTPSEEIFNNNSILADRYIKEINFLDDDETKKIIISTKDKEYIKHCIKYIDQYFTYERTCVLAIFDLMQALSENIQETIVYFFENKDEYNLTLNKLVVLVAFTRDNNFIKSIIDKREEYGLSSKHIMYLLHYLNNPEILKHYIENREAYGLERDNAMDLLQYTSDISYIINYILKNSKPNPLNKKIKLPKGMTIGIEIESEGYASKILLQYYDYINGWEVGEDRTLEDGVEVKSPVLHSEDHKEQEIYDICSILKTCGNTISDNCGGHVHIGADYLTNINAWKNLVEIWSNTEDIIFAISNKEGILPRNGVFEFARTISNNIQDAIEKGEIDLENEDDIKKFCNYMYRIQPDSHYSGINFANFGDKEKNTIEFRVSNGTLDPETWIENINLYGGIMAAAQELSLIQEKLENGIKLNDEEINKMAALEIIKNSKNEEDKLKSLLDLIADEEDRSIYYKRYRINTQLMGRKNNHNKSR